MWCKVLYFMNLDKVLLCIAQKCRFSSAVYCTDMQVLHLSALL